MLPSATTFPSDTESGGASSPTTGTSCPAARRRASRRRSATCGYDLCAGVAILSFYMLIGVVLGSIIFHFNALLDAAPILSWTVNGIVAIRDGAPGSAIAPALALVLTFLAAVFLGKRLA